jgi:hypothetical protein
LSSPSPSSPAVAAAGGALAAFAAFWLLLIGAGSFLEYGPGANSVIVPLVIAGGMLLFVAAWTLALTAAARERRWRWLALLALVGYLSVVCILIVIAPPDPCFFGPPPGLAAESVDFPCVSASPLEQWLVAAGYFAGPATIFVFGLRARIPGLRATPGSLPVSPLGTAADVEFEPGQAPEPESDSGLEVYRERL